MNRVVSQIAFLVCLSFVYGNATEFCVLIFYSFTLMNMFNNNNNNNLVSPISAIHVHMGVRSSTKAWSMYM